MNVGTYTVTVEMSGFKKMTYPTCACWATSRRTSRPTLQIGGLTEEITVSTPTDLVRDRIADRQLDDQRRVHQERAGAQPQRARLSRLPAGRRNAGRQRA